MRYGYFVIYHKHTLRLLPNVRSGFNTMKHARQTLTREVNRGRKDDAGNLITADDYCICEAGDFYPNLKQA